MIERYCQSCGRMMREEQDYGREEDGCINENYCSHCYRNGQFTEPNLTRWQIVARILPIWMKEKHLTYRDALVDANYFISSLRRWHARQTWT